jgi:peptidoglycan/LPS O-acetylase OafA/YrhL
MKPLRLTLGAPVRGRLPVLDELKGVAILLIILYHAGGVLSWANTLHGEVGVDMFVILSGIGLTLSGGHETAARFLGRRFLRIYPSYWIALTATLVAGAYFRGNHYAPADIVLHYLGIHAWFGDAKAMSINDSFWFITLIVTLYVVYLPMRPLLGRPDRLLLAGMALSLLLAWVHLRAGMPVGFANLSMRFPGFFLGLVVGRLLRDGTLELPLSPPWLGRPSSSSMSPTHSASSSPRCGLVSGSWRPTPSGPAPFSPPWAGGCYRSWAAFRLRSSCSTSR